MHARYLVVMSVHDADAVDSLGYVSTVINRILNLIDRYQTGESRILPNRSSSVRHLTIINKLRSRILNTSAHYDGSYY